MNHKIPENLVASEISWTLSLLTSLSSWCKMDLVFTKPPVHPKSSFPQGGNRKPMISNI